MANINYKDVKLCLIKSCVEFDDAVNKAFGEPMNITYLLDCVDVNYANARKDLNVEELYAKLASYYGVNSVTSILVDDNIPCNVCIIFEWSGYKCEVYSEMEEWFQSEAKTAFGDGVLNEQAKEDLLALWNASKGDEATRGIVLATLVCTGLEEEFRALLASKEE